MIVDHCGVFTCELVCDDAQSATKHDANRLNMLLFDLIVESPSSTNKQRLTVRTVTYLRCCHDMLSDTFA